MSSPRRVLPRRKRKGEKPRYLTSEEIDDIVSVIPRISAATKEISDHNTEQLKEIERRRLRRQLISPTAIPKLKKIYINQFYKSLVSAGEAVGVVASEAIGGPTTQCYL